MRRRIEIIQTSSGYLARDNDPETLRLFGTDTLPTAFTAKADAVAVIREIAALNPDALVYLVTR